MRRLTSSDRPARRPGAVVLGLFMLLVACGSEADRSVAARDDASTPATSELEVFFTNELMGDPCTEVFGVSRTVPPSDSLVAAMEALLTGPTDAERAEGYGGWFSQDTEGMLRSARLDGDIVRINLDDLRQVIPDASSSCGSSALLR